MDAATAIIWQERARQNGETSRRVIGPDPEYPLQRNDLIVAQAETMAVYVSPCFCACGCSNALTIADGSRLCRECRHGSHAR